MAKNKPTTEDLLPQRYRKDRHGRPLMRNYLPNILNAWGEETVRYEQFTESFYNKANRSGRFPFYIRPSRKRLLDKLEKYDNRARFGR